MAERVHPSSKPAVNGTAAATTVANGTAVGGPNGAVKPTVNKPQLRPPYRPQQAPYNHRRRRKSGRRICCCCCFWSILILLGVALLAAIAGAAVYVLYRPQSPEFKITSLRVSKLNLTTAADSSTSHLSSLLNLTVAAKNPNNHFTFFYDAFNVAFLTDLAGVQIANGSVPAFVGGVKNETNFRAIATAAKDLDTEASAALRSDLRRRTGVPMRIVMDTKVKVQLESVKSKKKVGIRVTCVGIRAIAPKGKSPVVVSVAGAKCKVDLRIKIWKWTF